MNNEILVFDMGAYKNVGIYSTKDETYIYYSEKDIGTAINRLKKAKAIVSYSGTGYDIKEISKAAGLTDGSIIDFEGEYIDMYYKYLSIEIPERHLGDVYNKVISKECPQAPFTETQRAAYDRSVLREDDSYLDSIERDVYMALKLWELWRKGKLVGE